jgi:hypothetical protein
LSIWIVRPAGRDYPFDRGGLRAFDHAMSGSGRARWVVVAWAAAAALAASLAAVCATYACVALYLH